jgi:hypothetical protein
MSALKHGTENAYKNRGCRCELCLAARREDRRAPGVDHGLIADLLNELFPFGLTDDCPARRQQQAAA